MTVYYTHVTGDVRFDGRLRQHDVTRIPCVRARGLDQLRTGLPAQEEPSWKGNVIIPRENEGI